MWYDHIQIDESKATNECPKSSNPEETPLQTPKKEKTLLKIKRKAHLKPDESKNTNECPRPSNSEETKITYEYPKPSKSEENPLITPYIEEALLVTSSNNALDDELRESNRWKIKLNPVKKTTSLTLYLKSKKTS
ncbi:uncharacterized protein LOC122756492 [Drosophila santomea]|uniref:uncharacterized protein LOC122756492 n=1 Tax=Drosophila santomea TaxID=129105 RepID=UPI001CCC8EE0|nr:uncharacterized protein LOC122756492 [Drosophila santomea]